MVKFRGILIATAALLALFLFVESSQADVTGNFTTQITFVPQTTASEISLIDFDVVNELNLTVSISGLSSTLHSHFGIAGVEDAILTLNGVMGFMSFNAQLVFGRFAFGSIVPFYDELHFISKTLTAEMGFGGISFVNTAQFKDANAFISQSTAYAFGDSISISGQTPSGILISAETGICLQVEPLQIKHHTLSGRTVNPDCATEPKPDLLFDFESIVIQNVPIAQSISSDTVIFCQTITACQLFNIFTFSGGPIPFTTALLFENLLELDFGFAEIALNSGPATLSLFIGSNGTLGLVTLDLLTTLNPETNPASLSIVANAVPGVGLTDATVGLSIARAGLVFGVAAVYVGAATVDFSEITFNLATTLPNSLGSLNTEASFDPVGGLQQGEITLRVNF